MSRLEVDVILDEDEVGPSCLHGPALLFSRMTADGEKIYYACSAHRERKGCSFYKLKSEWDKNNINYTVPKLQDSQPLTHANQFCRTCNMLLSDVTNKEHKKHDVLENLSQKMLLQPSKLLTPLDNAKSEAQYLFTEETVSIIVNNLVKCGVKKVLCVGAPRIHEYILSSGEKIESLMLDIDARYRQFYSETMFLHYNMFNHYFFHENHKDIYLHFLKNGRFALITDPPFGGRVEVLSSTLNKIRRDWYKINGFEDTRMDCGTMKNRCNEPQQEDFLILWMFPYFMEQHILRYNPDLVMMDMKVDYDNHSLFKTGNKGRKHGSPVRVFTNIPGNQFVLPTPDYNLCTKCNRYVCRTNKHCNDCNNCTSKDGRPYKHCFKCKRCVKCSYVHCIKCNRCHLQERDCQNDNTTTCHLCHMSGHKRRDCHMITQKNHDVIKTDASTEKSRVKVLRKKAKIKRLKKAKMKIKK